MKRWVVRGGERSLVAEADARNVPGAQAPRCLIHETEAAMRRIWHYPADWNHLEDSRLIALFDKPFVASEKAWRTARDRGSELGATAER